MKLMYSAQGEFLRLLALEKELKLNFDPPDNTDVYEHYMQGTINSNIQILTDFIFEIILHRGL